MRRQGAATGRAVDLLHDIWRIWLVADEWIGVVLGTLAVWLLVRQDWRTWPVGVAYVFVSITVLLEARLYANLALHIVGFLSMNLYGWYYWRIGGADDGEVPVTRTSPRLLLGLALLCAACTAALGTWFATSTDAALPFWDSGILVMSLAAFWLSARKHLENWMVWFVVDVISVAVYFAQGLSLYALLYLIYLGMAVWGFRTWRESMLRDARAAA